MRTTACYRRSTARPLLGWGGSALVLGLAGALLASCMDRAEPRGAARTAEPPVQRGPAREPIVEDKLVPERIDMAALGDSALKDMRGGVRVKGLDLSIGLQMRTTVEGQMQLTSQLAMNDAGQWVATGSRSESAPTASVSSTSGGKNTTVTISSAAPAGASQSTQPTGVARGIGGADFRAAVGDPGTTQVIHQLVGNSVASVISNRVDGARINQTIQLNVGINNLAQFSARMVALSSANRIGADVARARLR